MQLPMDVLKAAIVGLLIEEGWGTDFAWAVTENVDGPDFQRMARMVASVALTLHAHGLMRHATD